MSKEKGVSDPHSFPTSLHSLPKPPGQKLGTWEVAAKLDKPTRAVSDELASTSNTSITQAEPACSTSIAMCMSHPCIIETIETCPEKLRPPVPSWSQRMCHLPANRLPDPVWFV